MRNVDLGTIVQSTVLSKKCSCFETRKEDDTRHLATESRVGTYLLPSEPTS